MVAGRNILDYFYISYFIYMAVNKAQPDFLKRGDEVAIISPSFAVEDYRLDGAISLLESWGLKVRKGKNIYKRDGPFAGTDMERLSDLQEMTDDPSIKAVFFSRGGYGISRLIGKFDFSALMNEPKWFVGFSDITVMNLWLSEVCGIVSVHGEMAVNYNDPGKTEETFNSLKHALFGGLQPYKWQGTFFRQGETTGELTGGNLSLFCSMTGTPAEPDTKGKILFIEEVGENYYRIDRMLTSLKLGGKLKDLSALLVGGFTKLEDTPVPWGLGIEETISGIVGEYAYPVLFNFPAGHIADNRALYIGREASLSIEGEKAVLSFT